VTSLRKIIHVDMDAFYASVEQRDDPSLRGRPVIVGGRPDARGVVAACSYEARTFGIRSAMPSAHAKRLCPDAVFLRPRMQHYAEISRQIRAIFATVSDRIEPLSLDEAYLDVSENKLHEPLAGRLARYLKQEIKRVTGLTASAGVGPCKLVAKIASDVNKPDGLCIVRPEEVADFLAPLPVTRLWGVGPKTAQRLSELGIRSVADVRSASPDELERRLGRYGELLRRLSWGDDARPVESRREAKSRGNETTFQHDVVDLTELCETLHALCEELFGQLDGRDLRPRTATLKLRYADFQTITRSRSLDEPLRSGEQLYRLARELLFTATEAHVRPVRLIGVAVSSFASPGDPEQLSLDFKFEQHHGR
jgi:DNA polymerase-4